jgi:SAM-dependent methyltransferase
MSFDILNRFLSRPQFYDWFQAAIGGTRARRWTLERFLQLRVGDEVLDLGCGPGQLLSFLPSSDDFVYVGVDTSEVYISFAKRRATSRRTFLVADCRDLAVLLDRQFHWILCMGLLHHLDDESCARTLAEAAQHLRPDGTLICLEPTFFSGQSWLTQWTMKHDRGRFVRFEDAWLKLYRRWFDDVSVYPLKGAFRIPYVKTVALLKRPRIAPFGGIFSDAPSTDFSDAPLRAGSAERIWVGKR